MRAQHAAGIATGRARLATETRCVRHHPRRQRSLIKDLAGIQRSERHLGRGDCPQPVALDGKRIVGELREVTSSSERCGGYQRWRANLFERIGVAIERELAQRSRHRGAQAALQREHRAADLGAAFVIENA